MILEETQDSGSRIECFSNGKFQIRIDCRGFDQTSHGKLWKIKRDGSIYCTPKKWREVEDFHL